jgi:hypothetical protein
MTAPHPGPFDAGLSILKGAVIGIKGHAPEGKKKDRNLRQILNCIAVLGAAGKVKIIRDTADQFWFDQAYHSDEVQALLRAIREAKDRPGSSEPTKYGHKP